MNDKEKRAHLKKISCFLCKRYYVSASGGGPFLQGLSGALNYCGLTFGQVYRVRKPVDGNMSGGVGTGEMLRFIGAHLFPYEDGIRLYFEDMDSRKRQVEFSGVAPLREGALGPQQAHKVLAQDYLLAVAEPDHVPAKQLQRFAYCADLVRRGYMVRWYDWFHTDQYS